VFPVPFSVSNIVLPLPKPPLTRGGEAEIQNLDESNRLYLLIQEFCKPDIYLFPVKLSNLQMGYLFEELVWKFNEQAIDVRQVSIP
jgi:hypothetical protein